MNNKWLWAAAGVIVGMFVVPKVRPYLPAPLGTK